MTTSLDEGRVLSGWRNVAIDPPPIMDLVLVVFGDATKDIAAYGGVLSPFVDGVSWVDQHGEPLGPTPIWWHPLPPPPPMPERTP